MASAQQKAVRGHRSRQRQRGIVRVEVQVPEADTPLVRELAATLRGEPARARTVRTRLREALQPASERTLLDMLACDLPDDVIDEALARPRDLGREVPL